MDEFPVGDTPRERAEHCLELLRGGARHLFWHGVLVRLLSEITRAGLSLEDIGTSEEELKSLNPN